MVYEKYVMDVLQWVRSMKTAWKFCCLVLVKYEMFLPERTLFLFLQPQTKEDVLFFGLPQVASGHYNHSCIFPLSLSSGIYLLSKKDRVTFFLISQTVKTCLNV
ncbi:hypothetical protein ILYODFUR_001532 [Ilyodon furcidens]|uniref:Uncharacterized protein n=1 Tax=Ilyodon furcidens TaxID=33524 RepID=A0ABV0UN32_9TELE